MSLPHASLPLRSLMRKGPKALSRLLPETRVQCSQTRRSSMSQRPGSDRIQFPGAVNSKFTDKLEFHNPTAQTAMPTFRVMDSEGRLVDAAAPAPDIADEELVKLYMDMLTVSIMDLIMFDAQRQGRLSFYMVSAGEEGIAVGSASALTRDDVIFAQYREAGVLQHRGFTLKDFMSQLFNNRNDSGRGRNMPVHYGSRALKVHTISSPLATQIPQAAGAAYALKLAHLHSPSTSPPAIVACYFGEGAASEGDFHAGLNFAATRGCPVVFICRNNGYAISTTTLEQYRGDGIASRGTGYGIPTVRVDGNDVLAVRAACAAARRLALQGSSDGGASGLGPGPVLVEAMSYRVSHHSTSDDSSAYRPSTDASLWMQHSDPLARLRLHLQRRSLWDAERERGARSRVRAEVLAAFGAAEREGKAPLRAIFEDVYAELGGDQRRQMGELARVLDAYEREYVLDEFEGGRAGLREGEP